MKAGYAALLKIGKLFLHSLYVFHEVYAPKNYQKADDITFTAKHNKTIVMKDEKIKVKHNVVTMDASLRRDFLMLCSITSLCVLCMLRKRKRNLD